MTIPLVPVVTTEEDYQFAVVLSKIANAKLFAAKSINVLNDFNEIEMIFKSKEVELKFKFKKCYLNYNVYK